jgi:two-component system nitrate/nitrite response regulator NarL
MKHLLLCSKRSSVSRHILDSLRGDTYRVVSVSKAELLALSPEQLSRYDLLLIHLFHTEDIDILRQLHAGSVRTVVLDSEPSLRMALYVLEWGAKGYSNALASETNLRLAVDVAVAGNIYLPETYMVEMLKLVHPSATSMATVADAAPVSPLPSAQHGSGPLSLLTPRELEVADCIVQGYANKEIAVKLGITLRTVKSHLHSIFEKLDLHDRLSLALFLQKQ